MDELAMNPIAYLESKRTVDDRSRSVRVRDAFLEALPPEPTIVEAGAGTGAVARRLSDWGVRTGTYVGIDRDPQVLDHARRRTDERRTDEPKDDQLGSARVDDDRFGVSNQTDRTIDFVVGDALRVLRSTGTVDAIIAQQFMDLIDIERAFEVFSAVLAPGGVIYAPLTFDGVSIFQPPHPADERVLEAYHASMDARIEAASRTGRRLATMFLNVEGRLLAMDATDAIVRPVDGSYRSAEAEFLGYILAFVERSVPTEAVPEVDDWLETRREQLTRNELIYIAHRYDLLYRTPENVPVDR